MKKYVIIGDPLSHSLSPTLHKYWFKQYKIDADYSLMQIKENELNTVIDKIKNDEITGINITLPYKQKIIPFLDKLINNAKDCNSVNTVYKNDDQQIIGENTDVFGLQAGYLKEITNSETNKKKALVIGAGGVSSSVINALLKSNIKEISLINRTYEKTIFIKKNFPIIKILKWEQLENSFKNFDIIINATSLGLKNGEEFKIIPKDYKSNLIYIDTIYNPLQTKMIKTFKSNNIKTFNGLDMFIYQGQKSFYLWNKINPEVNDELINILTSSIDD